MRLPEPIERTGFFWAPEDTDNQLPGVLRISKTGAVTLEMFGPSQQSLSRRPLDDPALNQRDSALNRIVGIVGKNELVTLDSCFIKNWNSTFGGLWTSTIHANRAFIGAIYEDGQDITFSKIEFSVEGLDEWLGISGIKHVHNWAEKIVSVHFGCPEEIVFSLPDGVEMRFTFRGTLSVRDRITDAGVNQKAYISIKSAELRPLDYFIPLISKLHNFLCFAVDKTVSLESVTAYSTELAQKLDDGSTYEPPIKVYYQGEPYSETPSRVNWPNMLFSYGKVADEFDEIIVKWLNNYESLEPAFNLYFALKAGAHKYMDGKFLSLAQGIETLHRRNFQEKPMSQEEFSNLVGIILRAIPDNKKGWVEGKLKYANELSLRQRIGEMIRPFENFFGTSNERKHFISKVVDTRNYLTHYDSRLASQAASGRDLWTLCMKLEALFQLHFLRLIGIKDESISAIVEGHNSLRDKLGLQ